MITVSSLRIALNSPAIHFRRLKNIRWDEEHITLSTYFATTHIRLGSVRYLLCLPLREESMRRAERFITLHKHLECTAVPRLEIFRDEMSYLSSAEQELKNDILLEPLPDALPLTDAIATLCSEEAGRLLEGINKLEQQLLKADVSHNNIREEHLLINRFGTIFPIRGTTPQQARAAMRRLLPPYVKGLPRATLHDATPTPASTAVRSLTNISLPARCTRV